MAISDAKLRQKNGKTLFSAQQQEGFINALAESETQIHFHTFSIQSFRDCLNLFIEKSCSDFSISHISKYGIELIAVLHRIRDAETH